MQMIVKKPDGQAESLPLEPFANLGGTKIIEIRLDATDMRHFVHPMFIRWWNSEVASHYASMIPNGVFAAELRKMADQDLELPDWAPAFLAANSQGASADA